MAGYFSIERDLLSHEMWLRDPFSRGQAWVDLIGLANHKAGYIRLGGLRVDILRGQCGWSEVRLAQRWKWSRGKVRRFLDELEMDQMITTKTAIRTTIITICNYDKYQNHSTPNDTPNDTPNGQVTVHQTDTNNNEKNDKNDKKRKKEYTSDFENLWSAYPRKDGSKSKAFEIYLRALRDGVTHETITGKVSEYARSVFGKEQKYVAHFTTWLNGRRWEADYQPQNLFSTDWKDLPQNRMPSPAGG
ncbi:MAG: hypothetical protein KGL39_56995 [Patescibacteria group bacterium]|nr:hypothetical protein [Patescibacteria group bacterium]